MNTAKGNAVASLRRWLADSRITLPEHRILKNELNCFEEKVTPSGAITFGARGSGHDDYVALLLTAAMCLPVPSTPLDWSFALETMSGIKGSTFNIAL